AFGERDPGVALEVEKRRERGLFGVIGARWVARCRADPLISLVNQVVVTESLVRCIAPVHAPHFLVQSFRKGLRETIRQRRRENGTIVVVGLLCGRNDLLEPVT